MSQAPHGGGPAEPGSSESAHPAAPRGHEGRLILARHGQTDHNVARRLQGQVDIPLNAQGREQARALAQALSADRPDVIVASPLGRARETARAVGEAVGLPVAEDPAFLERGFGQWEGLTGPEIQDRWPEQHRQWRAHEPVHGVGVEQRQEVGERFAAACRALLREHPGQTVLVVSHGAAITLGITVLLGLDPEGFRGIAGLENCHRSVVEPLHADPTGMLMRLVSHNVPPRFA